MLDKENLILKFSNDLGKYLNSQFSIDNNELIYNLEEDKELRIDTLDIYNQYIMCENYEIVLKQYIKVIEESKNCNSTIDENKIFPILKHISFSSKNPVLSKRLCLDISICIVEDYGKSFRYITSYDINKKHINEIYEKAYSNLSNIFNKITPIDSLFGIYTFEFNNELMASFLINKNILKNIIKTVGPKFIFIIPNSSVFIFARDTNTNIELLEQLANVNTDESPLSFRVYRYNKGEYEYADLPDIFSNNKSKNIFHIVK